MHPNRVTPLLTIALALAGCAAPAPQSPAPAAQQRTRVFVEMLLLDLPADQLGSVTARSFADLADENQRAQRAVSSPHLLVDSGQQGELQVGAQPANDDAAGSAVERAMASYRVDVSPQVVGDRIQLAVRLSFDPSTTPVATTLTVDNRQRTILPTQVAEDGHVLVVLVEQEIVRSEADLKAIYDRKALHRSP